jgi:hypothetical protein
VTTTPSATPTPVTVTVATAAATQIKVPYHRTPFEERVQRAMAAAAEEEAGVAPELDDDSSVDGAGDENVAPHGPLIAPTAALTFSAPAPLNPQRPALVALPAAAIRTRSPSFQHMIRSPAPSPQPAVLAYREPRLAEGAAELPSPTTPARHDDDGIHNNGVTKYHPDNSVPLHHTPFSTRVDRVMRFGW